MRSTEEACNRMGAKYGPYSPLCKAGSYYYISGQVGVDATTREAALDVGKQAKQALENLRAVLAEHDLKMSDVVKTTVFLTDMANFDKVNEVYATYFSDPFPARTCVEVSGLPRVVATPLLIEIEAVAYTENIANTSQKPGS